MMFDLDRIVKEYPNAWNKVRNFYNIPEDIIDLDYTNGYIEYVIVPDDITQHHRTISFSIRDLYDFFDRFGINVYIMPISGTRWFWNISKKRLWAIRYLIGKPKGAWIWSSRPYESQLDPKPEFKSRIEAEYTAFFKAFEILETKLIKGMLQ